MAWSAPATGRLAVTVPVAGSIRWTVRSWPPTQTAVHPTAMNAGSPASGIRPAALAVVRSALGSNRSTSRARWLGTQTEPKPMATPWGWATLTVPATVLVSGSILLTSVSSG
jgi:hypothetical protein